MEFLNRRGLEIEIYILVAPAYAGSVFYRRQVLGRAVAIVLSMNVCLGLDFTKTFPG